MVCAAATAWPQRAADRPPGVRRVCAIRSCTTRDRQRRCSKRRRSKRRRQNTDVDFDASCATMGEKLEVRRGAGRRGGDRRARSVRHELLRRTRFPNPSLRRSASRSR